VLAYQRYGLGKALALTVQDSWLYQMHASMPLEDMTHENLWRQLLRWVVEAVPDSVDIHTSSERVEAGEPVTLTAEVVDKSFVELNDARVVAKVKDPQGNSVDVPLQWTGERSGEYKGTFTAATEGMYTADVEASREGKPLGTSSVHMRAAPGDGEYFDASMHAARLKRIADETGGKFYTPDTVNALPEDLKYAGRGVTTIEERDLWHMPIVLLLIGGLMAGEWAYRRAVGFA